LHGRYTFSTQHSALSIQQSAISNQHSAISNQHSAFSNQQSAFSIQHSAISIQQSAFRTIPEMLFSPNRGFSRMEADYFSVHLHNEIHD
jgi:hypothetical protein